MRTPPPARTAQAIRALSRDPARGPVFWWLYDAYEPLRAATRGRRIAWKALAGDLAALGLTDATGQPAPGPRALRRTFDRVRQLKQREAAAQTQPAVPRRRRPSNTPPVAVRTESVTASGRGAGPPDGPSVGSDPATEGDGADPLIRQFRKRSGWRD